MSATELLDAYLARHTRREAGSYTALLQHPANLTAAHTSTASGPALRKGSCPGPSQHAAEACTQTEAEPRGFQDLLPRKQQMLPAKQQPVRKPLASREDADRGAGGQRASNPDRSIQGRTVLRRQPTAGTTAATALAELRMRSMTSLVAAAGAPPKRQLLACRPRLDGCAEASDRQPAGQQWHGPNSAPKGNADNISAATAHQPSGTGLESSSGRESIASSRHPPIVTQTAAEAFAPQSSVTGPASSHTATCQLQQSPTETAEGFTTTSDQQPAPLDCPALHGTRTEACDAGEIHTAVQRTAGLPGVRGAASGISAGAWQDRSQAVVSERLQSRLSQPDPDKEGALVGQQGMGLASTPDSPLQPVQSCNGKRADSTGQALPVGSGSQDGLCVSTELQSVLGAQRESERHSVSSKCQPPLQDQLPPQGTPVTTGSLQAAPCHESVQSDIEKEGHKLHKQRSGSSRGREACTQTHGNLAQSKSCQAAPLVADPTAESLHSCGGATSSGSSQFAMAVGGRRTSKPLDAAKAQTSSRPADGNEGKHPPERRTATAAESEPDGDRTVITGSLVETARTGTAARIAAPRAWEPHAARSHVGGSGGHLSGDGGGHLSGNSTAARIRAVAPCSFSAQPAVSLPVVGSEALSQRPGRMWGAVGQSEVSRRLQALRGRWQRFCALQQRQKALLEEADSSMPASGWQLCSQASAGQSFLSSTAAPNTHGCKAAGSSPASPLQNAAAALLSFQPGPSHGLRDCGIPEHCMDGARPALSASDAASICCRMAGSGASLAEERRRGFSSAESSSCSSSGAAGVRVARVRLSATRRPESLAERWQMHDSLGTDAGSLATMRQRPGQRRRESSEIIWQRYLARGHARLETNFPALTDSASSAAVVYPESMEDAGQLSDAGSTTAVACPAEATTSEAILLPYY